MSVEKQSFMLWDLTLFIFFETNSAGTNFGRDTLFRTSGTLPLVLTLPADSIRPESARCGGNIIDDGGCLILLKGICWSRNPNPDTCLSTKKFSGNDTSVFYCKPDHLIPNTLYYFRSFAVNKTGISYGDVKSFSTIVSGIDSSGTARFAKIYSSGSAVYIDIRIGKYPSGEVRIYNVTGKEVFSGRFGGETTRIDLSGFTRGIYLVRLRIDRMILNTKVFIF